MYLKNTIFLLIVAEASRSAATRESYQKHTVHKSPLLEATKVDSEKLVEELQRRYHDDISECYDRTTGAYKPAFHCSGILIRGISSQSNLKYPWSMKPYNKEKKSFAIGFLRRDAPFQRFPGDCDAGFIVYPYSLTPGGRNTYEALCAFVIDGSTDRREGHHACGKYKEDSHHGSSRPCQEQGITTFESWKTHFWSLIFENKYIPRRQCGFDMTSPNAAENFAVVLKAKKWLVKDCPTCWNYGNKGKQYPGYITELRLASWNENHAEKIPIEAFFYFLDSNKGRKKAEEYKAVFKDISHIDVPVVGIQLPTKMNGMVFRVVTHHQETPPSDGVPTVLGAPSQGPLPPPPHLTPSTAPMVCNCHCPMTGPLSPLQP